MAKSIISEGKTTSEAIEKGLKAINLPRELVEIKVIEENKKSFFDILAPKIVKVEIKEKEAKKPEEFEIETTEEELEIAKNDVDIFLKEFVKSLPTSAEYTLEIKEKCLYVNINGQDIGNLIGYRGEALYALENILKAVSSYTRGKVISVFGCGGDRDARKRPIMGEISGKIADYTIITSDNPRTEDPEKIVKQIEEGIKKTKGKYEVIVDRTKAIEKAIKMSNKNDIIILAGKGHEPYQEINEEKYPFDERVIVNEIINNKIQKKG